MGAIDSRQVVTPRLSSRVLFSGPRGGVPVIFVHGNLSSADWWVATMLRLPKGFCAIAPDLRAYGGADPAKKIDATRGMGDFSDDLAALMDELSIHAAHLVGHSLGGSVLWRFLADHPGRVLSLTQVCPGSPYGFGAIRPDGTPCYPDGAGQGAEAVNPELVRLMGQGARGAETPAHPLAVLNTYVWKPPFVPEGIDAILTGTLRQHIGPQDYPGDSVPSTNWPGAAPGRLGPINALAGIYQRDPLGFVGARAPILWLRGADDPVVADGSLFDIGTLGSLGAIPGWPGAGAFPPQPMVSQTAAALTAYEAAGGAVTRVVLPDCGHSPYLERPAAFDAAFHAHICG